MFVIVRPEMNLVYRGAVIIDMDQKFPNFQNIYVDEDFGALAPSSV